jgi:hypothetical protein
MLMEDKEGIFDYFHALIVNKLNIMDLFYIVYN